MKKLKAFKVFNPDWTCRGFQYKVGETYTHKGKIKMCASGFHACEQVADCFNYQSFDPNNKVAIVQLSGDIIKGDDKCVASVIKIVKEVSWSDMLVLANTGKGNSGHRNSGDRNSGDSNSGYRNSGDSNSGYRNSGDSNSGDSNSGDSNSGDSNSGYRNSGVFCNKGENSFIEIFNQPSKWTWYAWHDSVAYSTLQEYFVLTTWVDWDAMTDTEKLLYPKAYVTEGYLKVYEYKQAWANLWAKINDKAQQSFKDLPNFDADIFFDITGIKV